MLPATIGGGVKPSGEGLEIAKQPDAQYVLRGTLHRQSGNVNIAAAYALLGEKENALRWLETAKKSRASNFNYAAVDARFEKIQR